MLITTLVCAAAIAVEDLHRFLVVPIEASNADVILPRGLNEVGDVVGAAAVDGQVRPAKWSEDGGFEVVTDRLLGVAADINDAGVVAVNADWPDGSVWLVDGESVVRLPDPPGSIRRLAWRINESSEVVGFAEYDEMSVPVVWRDGGVTVLPPHRGAPIGGQARDIDDQGRIVGWAYRADGSWTATMWIDDVAIDLAPGYASSSAWAISGDYITGEVLLDRDSGGAARWHVSSDGWTIDICCPDEYTKGWGVDDDGNVLLYTHKLWPSGGGLFPLEAISVSSRGDISVHSTNEMNGAGVITAFISQGGYTGGAILKPIRCSGDTDASGVIDNDDLLAVLAAWGPCSSCPADTNGDGHVDVEDLLTVVAQWGPCG